MHAKGKTNTNVVKLLSGPSLGFLIVVIWSGPRVQGDFRPIFIVVSGDCLAQLSFEFLLVPNYLPVFENSLFKKGCKHWVFQMSLF